MMIALSAVIAGFVAARGDHSRLAFATAIAVGVAAVTSALNVFVLRKLGPIPLRLVAPMNAPHLVAAFLTSMYIGFFSPFVLLYVVGAYAMSAAVRPVALYAYAMSAGILGLGMFSIALGLVPDMGLVHADLDRGSLVTLAAGTQVAILALWLYGRRTGVALRESILRLEGALREVEQRDALLGEANRDLERALRARGAGMQDSVVGSWRIEGMLGRGGMGEVYAARHVERGERAALKVMSLESREEAELVERFRREAKALARLDHPNVVKLLDVGDGFLAMELLEGHDLAALLRRRRALSNSEVGDLATQVARALAYAREADVVHRDLKPQNVFFVEATRTWKVLDFGISKVSGATATLTGDAMVGTPAYMAPEQVDGSAVDHRADVFALAAVAYRALTGRPAFSASDNAQLLFDVLGRQPQRPSTFAQVDPDVDLAFALGLAKDREARVARAEEFAAALVSAFRGQLDESLRARARALVAAHPWGRFVAERTQPTVGT